MTRPIVLAMALAVGLAPAGWAQSTTTQPVPGPTTAQQGAPPRANSFTEDQARRRMADAGLREIRNLTLGEDGVWRAAAVTPQGRAVQVNMDYQGVITLAQGPQP